MVKNRPKVSPVAFGTSEDPSGQEDAEKGIEKPQEAVKEPKKSIQNGRVSVFCLAVKGEAD